MDKIRRIADYEIADVMVVSDAWKALLLISVGAAVIAVGALLVRLYRQSERENRQLLPREPLGLQTRMARLVGWGWIAGGSALVVLAAAWLIL